VATYCSKCGTELAPGAQSCASCGTSVAVPVAAAAPGTLPPAPPQTGGNNAVKIILIVVAVVVGLGIVGVACVGYIGYRVARSVHVSGSGKEVTINTPGGSISTNASETFTSADLGTDIYPGATTGKGSMRMSLPTGSMVTAVYVTGDSKDQVVSFYKEKFGSDVSVMDSSDTAVITGKKGENESVVVTVTPNSSQYEGRTQVAIVHTTATKGS
jgi:zinc ribbon protein